MKHLAAVGKSLADPQPLIRGRAAGLLEDLGPAAAPAAGAARDALSKEDEPGVQEQLVNALAAMGPGAKGAVGALLPLIADRTAGTAFREKLILTAVALDPASPDVAGAVRRAAGSADVGVRRAARAWGCSTRCRRTPPRRWRRWRGRTRRWRGGWRRCRPGGGGAAGEGGAHDVAHVAEGDAGDRRVGEGGAWRRWTAT